MRLALFALKEREGLKAPSEISPVQAHLKARVALGTYDNGLTLAALMRLALFALKEREGLKAPSEHSPVQAD